MGSVENEFLKVTTTDLSLRERKTSTTRISLCTLDVRLH